MKKLKASKNVFFIAVLITAALLYVAFYGLHIGTLELKGADEMRFGIDIRGGAEATYTPKELDRTPTADELEAAKSIIETRMDAANISDREVMVDESSGAVIVRFPWKSGETDFDPQQAISELGETALLTFRDPDNAVVLEGADVTKSYASFDEQSASYVVVLELSPEGTKKFAEATARLVGQRISIYMDDTEISAPTVNSAITDGSAIITGQTDLAEAKELAAKINSGSLPFSMIAHDANIISPTLGLDALGVMILAGQVAFGLVCLFMLLYYRLPGFVACIALVLQVVGQLLALSIPQFTLTLPGIAGVILSIGMGVDANVIVSERIKEELNAGKTLRSAIDAGFHRAFASVFDGNITVIIVSVVLIALGSGSMLSFGYTLLCGVIMNFLAGVTASRLMIKSLSAFKGLQEPALYGARRVTE
ncbi:MAG: protein translocase subunit SecD [Oscillospiraceae bacterium]|nr:protein translocase subunit SecD [Oscillospiraceae bacterium]